VLGVLAAPSLLGGYLGGWLHGRLDGLLGPAPHVHWAAWASGGFAVGGAALAIVLYGPLRGWATHSGIDRTVVHRLLWNSYYIDELYGLLIVGPVRRLGRVCTWIDDHGIDNLLLAVTWAPRGLGRALRTAQRSSLGGYALAFAVGAVLLTVVLMMLR